MSPVDDERSGPGEPPAPTETILGIRFYLGSIAGAVASALEGALVLAPSGPGLAVDLVGSAAYRQALLQADINLTDSGFMLLLWQWRTGRKLPRLSGLGFLRVLLEHPRARAAGGTFWVMPSAEEQAIHLRWMRAQGVQVEPESCYLAPRYGRGVLEDPVLLARIRQLRPRVVILAIGGGVQERLGLSLARALENDAARPGVVCIGAAIAFLSGAQVNIPPWADRWKLGWLMRLCSSPRRYVPRYFAALHLARLVRDHADRLPPLRSPAID